MKGGRNASIRCHGTFFTLDLRSHEKGFMRFQFVLSTVLTHCLSDMIEFTDEEGYGKYLDLHECYDRFINLKGMDVRFYFLEIL